MSDIAGLTVNDDGDGPRYRYSCYHCGCVGTFDELPERCPFCHVEMPTRKGRTNKYTGYYGEEWDDVRAAVLDRDGYECQRCGVSQDELSGPTALQSSLHVHHIEKSREFDTYDEANGLENLESLCQPCHLKAEHQGDRA